MPFTTCTTMVTSGLKTCAKGSPATMVRVSAHRDHQDRHRDRSDRFIVITKIGHRDHFSGGLFL
jgi:hypothetical protein